MTFALIAGSFTLGRQKLLERITKLLLLLVLLLPLSCSVAGLSDIGLDFDMIVSY